jgi:methyl-accepting chemotaxis protein
MKAIPLKFRFLMLNAGMFAGLILLAGISNYKAGQLMGDLDDVATTQLPAVKNMTYADMMHDGIRGVVLDGFFAKNEGDLGRLEELKKELDEKVGLFHSNIKDLEALKIKPSTLEAIVKVKPELERYGQVSGTILNLLLKDDLKGAKAKMPEFQGSFEALEKEMESLGEKIEADASASRDGGKDAKSTILLVSFLLIISIAAFSWYNYFKLNRDLSTLNERLNRVTGSISKTGAEIAGVSTSVAEASTQQSSAVRSSVDSMEQVKAGLKKSVDTSVSALENVVSVSRLSEEGHRAVQGVVQAMKTIEDANTQVRSLGEVIQQIQTKTVVIKDIVFQSQLLSFNASIEAARAGIHGKGFAVVAEEVGTLAKTSGIASENIQALISSSMGTVSETLSLIEGRVKLGVETTGAALESFQRIADSIVSVKTGVQDANEATQLQYQNIESAFTSISELGIASDQNQIAANQAKAISENLDQENRELQSLVDELNQFLSQKKAA